MLSNNEIAVFCEQSGMILESGLSMLEGISIMEADVEPQNTEYKRIYADIRTCLEETGIFYEALQRAGVFPDYVIQMAKLGEETGNLDVTMKGLAAYYEREENTMQDIRSAISYPLMILCMLLTIMLVMIVKVMPVFDQVFQELGVEMSGAAAGVLHLGNGLRRYALVFLILFLLLAVGLLYLTRTTKGRIQLRTIARKFPLSRRLMYDTSCARFASGMSVALKSGLDTEEGFDLVTQLVDDPDFCQKIASAREAIQNGEDFSDALNKAGIFSGIDARMVSVGFRAGAADSALSDIASRLQTETDEKLQSLAGLLEPTLVAVLSVLVGLILLSVMLPLVNVMSNIG